MPSEEAFYELDGDRFISTDLTRGPWDAGAQHAGPPAALVGRAIERVPEPDGTPMRVARITYEILKPIPIAPLRVTTEMLRGGKRVQLIEARLLDEAGEVLIRASAWRIRVEKAIDVPPVPPEPPPPGPAEGRHEDFFPTGYERGYHSATEYRFLSGAFMEPGPAAVWMRPRVALVAGEAQTPLSRVLVVADSGNGVSSALDWRRYLFINVELSVHLHRYPTGDWVGLDARTIPGLDGIGMTETRLFDEDGPLGRSAQALMVADRGSD